MATELKRELTSGARSVASKELTEELPDYTEVSPYELKENQAITDILKVLRFNNKYDEKIFNSLPLTDRQKEQMLFDTIPELKDFKKIFGSNKDE
jgi:hypothetical protein